MLSASDANITLENPLARSLCYIEPIAKLRSRIYLSIDPSEEVLVL